MHKIGILGASRIAPQAIIEPVARRDDVIVHAVASRRAGAAEPYALEHRIAHAYDSYEAMLEDSSIDIIYNSLPPVDHARWSISALEAGKHVLCEKPFAMNAREAEVMVDSAQRTGKHLVEAFHSRLHPAFLHLLELKKSGALGMIKSIDAVFEIHMPFGEHEIRHLPDQGGGALMDLGCYPVHWVRTFMGSEPKIISATGTYTPMGVDESMEAELEFSGGVGGTIRTDMSEGTAFKAMLSIECENGQVELENPVLPHRGHSIRERLNGGFKVHTIAAGTTFDYQLAALLDTLDNGTPAVNGGADAIGNMVAIDAIYEAAGFGPR